jgi:HEPN domain-containing protein
MDLDRLAQSYVKKARARRKALDVLLAEESYSDVVREAQEICELSLKAVLRATGIEPPKFHDVGKLVRENVAALPRSMHPQVDVIARYSFELRRDRELAFYGAMDVDPWEDYSAPDADRAMTMVDEILRWIEPLFGDPKAP